MIIDLKKMRGQGKDQMDFCFECEDSENLSLIPQTVIKSPIVILGNVTITGKSSAFIIADVSFTLQGECTRCLKQIERTYHALIEEEFFDKNYAEGDDYTYFNDRLDLSKAVKDAILMNMPLNFLCEDECEVAYPITEK
jgi:uncharacterized protein